MAEKKKQVTKRKSGSERVGGREFGNVIEPMQAQMASGNQGLAAQQENPRKKAARKKAA